MVRHAKKRSGPPTWLDVMKGYRGTDHPIAKVAEAWCRARRYGGGPRRKQMRREHVLEWAGKNAGTLRDELDRIYCEWAGSLTRGMRA